MHYYNKLSSADFTYGNILLLYCIFNTNKSTSTSSTSTNNNNNNKNESSEQDNVSSYLLPDYITGRINVCIEIFNVIMNSKPDKFHTSIVIVSKDNYTKEIKEKLIAGGVSEQYLEYDNVSKTVESAFNNILKRITKLSNPPSIYFIGSVWQKDIFNSIVASKLKEYMVFFEGALDNRSYDVVQKEKLSEEPKKGYLFYKNKMTNKAIDMLLNYIFPKNKNK
jgi:hypothetical protein